MRQGDIELKSGSWKWTVTELEGSTEAYGVGARPPGEADPASVESGQPLLLLEDPSDPQHWMSRQLPAGSADGPIPEEELRALARNPGRRNLVDSDGTIWTIERIGRPEAIRAEVDFERGAQKVRVAAAGGQKRTMSLPDDRPLGTVTRDEMLQLVRT